MTIDSRPLFGKIALLGIGLIGSSIAHAARRAGLAAHIAGYARREETLAEARTLGFADSLTADPAEAVRDADLVILCTPVGSFGELAQRIAAHLKPGAILSDVGLGEGRGGARCRPACPGRRASHSGPSRRGHRTIGTGGRLCRAVRWPLVHTYPAAGHRRAGARASDRVLEALRQRCRNHGSQASRSGAGDHLPCAASDRLQYRRHRRRSRNGDPKRSHQVLGRRLSRFHAHRGFRSDDVARCLPQQSRGRARDAGPLQRGSEHPAARDPLGRWRGPVQPVHAHPRHPPRHRQCRARRAPNRISAATAPGPTIATISRACREIPPARRSHRPGRP